MKIDTSKIKAIIFDMDGLLVNSEPCWHVAEKNVFKKLGIELTTAMCIETTGKPVLDVLQYWYDKKPWPNPDFKRIAAELFASATEEIKNIAPLMPGVLDVIAFAKSKNYKIGLASASPIDMIELVLKKFNLVSSFDFYHSAELEEFNKPHPAVYLTVAKKLDTPIANCLILEDSGNGVKGAIASGAQVIAIPSHEEFHESKFNQANLKLSSLEQLPKIWV
jgi:mannitol-1-/sugar-/sorbitol-6-/2-deoxyglucose-6-phosphatase